MRLAGAILLLGLLGQDEDPIIDRLRSSDLEVREAATEELVKLGRAGLPRIERLAKHPDAEVSTRAKSALQEIARRERVRAVCPESRRLTIELKDTPTQEAAKKLFGPFSIDVNVKDYRKDAKKRRVSLTLSDATLWQTVDAFLNATQLKLRWFAEHCLEWTLESDPSFGFDPFVAVADAGPARLGITFWSSENFKYLHAGVAVALPPGHHPMSKSLADVKVTPDVGEETLAEHEPTDEKGDSWQLDCRLIGRISRLKAGSARFVTDKMKNAKMVRIEGTLVLGYPHDIDRTEFGAAGEDKPSTKTANGMTMTLAAGLNQNRAFGYSLEYKSVGHSADGTYFMWGEDSEGRWVGDVNGRFIISGEAKGGGMAGSTAIRSTSPASKMIVARFVGEDKVRIPFVIKELRVPEK